MFPFSFAEFCRYYAGEQDTAKLFDEYVIKGGLAGSYEYRTERNRTNYIRDVYDTIINFVRISLNRIVDGALFCLQKQNY